MIKAFKYPLILFLIGIIVTFFGFILKTLDISAGGILLIAGMILQAVALGFFFYSIVKNK